MSNLEHESLLWIENVSRDDIRHGWHNNPQNNTWLIQISDVGTQQPETKYSFDGVFKFWFNDVEDPSDAGAISNVDASAIARILIAAKAHKKNVIVHCYAGICCSGAVVEVAVNYLWFQPTEGRNRIPNTLVKNKILDALGFRITPETSVFREEFLDRSFD